MSSDPSADEAIPVEPESGPVPAGASRAVPLGVPVARPASTTPGPLLDLEGDTCPNCHAPMAEDAVVCMRCGFDQKAGVIRKPEVSTVEVAPKVVVPDFVVPARLSPKVLGIVGGCFAVLAMIATGVNLNASGWNVVFAGVTVSLYGTLVHSCTGLGAVLIAARLSEQRLGRVDLAVARMFVAFAIFQLITSLAIPGVPQLLSKGVVLLVAAGAYLLSLMILFKKDHSKAGMIALAHVGLYAVIMIGEMLTVWFDRAVHSGPGPG